MLLSIIISVVIGAAIGGFTNLVAIQMLFRPYSQWHVGRWAVPFTPGLIPKRHEELASQLGLLVTNHLLTSEGIKRAVEDRLKERIFSLVNDKISKQISNPTSIRAYLQNWMAKEDYERLLAEAEDKSTDMLIRFLYRELEEMGAQSLTWGELASRYIPEAWEIKMKEKTADALQKGLIRFVESGGLQQPLQQFVSQMTGGGQGMFGKLASMFIDESKITGMVEPKIIEYLSTEQLRVRLYLYLDTEWQEIKGKQISLTLERYNISEQLENVAKQAFGTIQPFEKLLDLPLSKLVTPLQLIVEPYIEGILNRLWNSFILKLEKGLTVMELDQVVKHEVLSFPLPKLEKIIVDIAGKELRLITLLGALLGGIIGLIQGALYFVINQ